MKYLRSIVLIARREYLAYVTAWGFWVSLITTPLLLGMVVILPVTLRQAEPTRYVAVLSDREADAEAVRDAIEAPGRERARGALGAYAQRVAPAAAPSALSAYDAAPDVDSALEAGLDALDRAAPGASAHFTRPAIPYEITLPPAPDIDGLKPYLSGARTLAGGVPLFAAFVVRGEGDARVLEYWSANLTDQSAADRARAALATLMRRDALTAHGLNPGVSAHIETLQPAFVQYDPRQGATAPAVSDRDRAPFVLAIGLAVLLWSATFGVANMLLTGVLEEKSNKILDALLTSVSPLQILTGKLLGVGGVSVTLFGSWALFASIGLGQAANATGAPFIAALAHATFAPGVVAIFLGCFIAGYLMYGAAFLGLGSMCDSLQEAQTLLGPVFFLLIPPILLVGPAFENPKSPVIVAASWIPPFTPFVMPMRAPSGLSFTEAAGPMALLALSVLGVLFLAARVFRSGVSHQLKVADLFKRKRPASA